MSIVLRHRVAGIAAASAVVVALCGIITVASPSRIRPPSQTFAELLSGPIGGWIGAVRASAFPEALGLLLPATMLTVGPALLYVLRGSRLFLSCAAVMWVASGYIFAIAIGA